MSEHLTKAVHDIGFVVSDLREALKSANPMEALILINAIMDAATLESTITAIADATSKTV